LQVKVHHRTGINGKSIDESTTPVASMQHRRLFLPPVPLILLILVANLRPVLTIQWQICCQYKQHQWQIATAIKDFGGK
jgi:hypothetical protein